MINSVRRCGTWLAVAVLTGCLGNDVVKSGTLHIRITDAAVDGVAKVVLQVSGLDLHSEDGTQTFIYDEPKQFDLLELNGVRFETLVGPVEVPAGNYDWIRLRIDSAAVGDSFVELPDASLHELTVVNTDNTGVKLTHAFYVPANQSKSVTLDLDLRKSLRESNGQYRLVATTRLLDSIDAGSIRSRIDSGFFFGTTPPCDADSAFVYVFDGKDAALSDITGGTLDPVTTVRVIANERIDAPNEFVYIAGASNLPEGPYTVALSCDAVIDVPDQADAITFLVWQNVDVGRNNASNIFVAYPI